MIWFIIAFCWDYIVMGCAALVKNYPGLVSVGLAQFIANYMRFRAAMIYEIMKCFNDDVALLDNMIEENKFVEGKEIFPEELYEDDEE